MLQTLINVGDEITTDTPERVIIDSVEQGKHGIFIMGKFDSGEKYGDYLVPELPPKDRREDWYGFSTRAYIVLASGLRLATLCFFRSDPRVWSLQGHEEEWERTIEQMREEQDVTEIP